MFRPKLSWSSSKVKIPVERRHFSRKCTSKCQSFSFPIKPVLTAAVAKLSETAGQLLLLLPWHCPGPDTRILHGGERKVQSFAHLGHQVIRKSWALVGKEAEKELEAQKVMGRGEIEGRPKGWKRVYVKGGRPEPRSGSAQVQPSILGQSNLLNRFFVPVM